MGHWKLRWALRQRQMAPPSGRLGNALHVADLKEIPKEEIPKETPEEIPKEIPKEVPKVRLL